jgi:uncharacterized damage-inducible protein DinB
MTNVAFEPALDQLLDYRAQLLARLEQQPAELAAVLAAIPEAHWHQRPAGLSRTVHRTLAHVRDLELLAFLPRLQRILSEDEPALAPFVSHDWSLRDYLPNEPLTAVLASWSQTRAEVINLLPGPASAQWSRMGFHPPSGKRSLQWWAERIYTHAQAHQQELRAARTEARP